MKKRAVILDGYTQNPGDLNWNHLNEVFDLTVWDRTPPEKIIERAKGAQVVIVNKVSLTKDIIDGLLPELEFTALLSTGYNVVDGAYLREKGISVSNIPSYSTGAVAQMVFSYILAFSNRTAEYSASVHAGDWVKCPDFCYYLTPTFELCGKVLGIVGFGQIGAAVAKTALSFGMKVIAFTPSGKKSGFPEVEFTSLEDVKARADVITLHCPLTKATEGLVDSEFLRSLKDGAYLINTSRGPVINENDVADALNAGKLAGFAADVLSSEPPKSDNPLLSSPNTVLTPHISWAGFETRERLLSILNSNIDAFIAGALQNVVN